MSVGSGVVYKQKITIKIKSTTLSVVIYVIFLFKIDDRSMNAGNKERRK